MNLSSLRPLVLAGIPLAILFTWSAVSDLLTWTPIRDFAAFHASGLACCDPQLSWYVAPQPDRPNLNPPTTILVLFSWMGGWDLRTAAIVWTFVSMIAVALVIGRIRTALSLSGWQTLALTGALLASFPARVVWSQGQIVWVLAVLVTEGWIAARAGRMIAAGLWLAPAIALKPILAVLPFALGWRILAVAALGGGGITASSLAVTGPKPWSDWVALSADVTWLGKPDNLSIAGVVVRHGWPLWVGSLALLACILAFLIASRLRPDARWVLGGSLTLLVSPLGWAYYLPLWVGPMMAVALARPPLGFWFGLLILFIPMSIWTLAATSFQPALSIYTVGVIAVGAASWYCSKSTHSHVLQSLRN